MHLLATFISVVGKWEREKKSKSEREDGEKAKREKNGSKAC